MGFTNKGNEQVATCAEQLESGNRDPTYVEEEDFVGKVCDCVWCVFLIAFVIGVFIVVFYYTTGAPYSFEKNAVCKNEMKTSEYGISYYVPSSERFDKKYPVGTRARAEFEKYYVIKDYIEMEQEQCKDEIEAQESFSACDKLRDMGIIPYPKV